LIERIRWRVSDMLPGDLPINANELGRERHRSALS
jgi:hypothetical protein